MVFFTCNACGESLKKAQVDKHVGMCRGCQVLSCIDCGKDFWADDYKNHLRCISEDQKYGGKGFEAKANKGEVKQQQWIQRIQEAMNKPGISPKIKDILSQVSSYDNVPRKKAKFQNWMKNSLKIHTPTLHDQVWEIFSAATSNAPQVPAEKPQPPAVAVKADTNGSEETQQNGSTEETDPDKKKKLNKRERKEARSGKSGKRKQSVEDNVSDEQALEEGGGKKSKKEKKRKKACEENEDGQQNGVEAGEEIATKKRKKSKDTDEDNQTTEAAEEQMDTTLDETASKGKFNWKGTIKAVLRQAPEEGLSVKKLRKKVVAAYYSHSGEANFRSEEDLIALFNKKISKNPKFRLLKDKVRLVQ